ncbi:uncharacterized protein LOC117328194 [Pecten maximus]|uniref:uncharacterized protein LOC117328194 n=1 Tax=Pecten maximus TaxID=6579 RepID=UPI001458DBCE|nr:uncharacterized protein LOC117328194 [Pecten maximus]XP_033741503.1 uncharacterized protein LOC117328194 [Pecten maximus]XP_033741504.1 uncharacterized protein LOC117328194 [Pecten maximus]XP_033741505.1 uncharacterized protein LOC117328194 [Pecten maximus]XP_033741506.1 uncharacterized protein LOC117328194 [Pecten maximus]XP_033741508.1 uncharacterized protein LOC117328194 [Pecten maximus]XP_033741509.1 uncharacterized protein LOC117328194 [Pecten maximus]XP_033741510.1 uncharacterized p
MASLDSSQYYQGDAVGKQPSKASNQFGRKRFLRRSDEIDEGVPPGDEQCSSFPDLVNMASSQEHVPIFSDFRSNEDQLPDLVSPVTSPRIDHPVNIPLNGGILKQDSEPRESTIQDRATSGILKRNPTALDKATESQQGAYNRSVSFQDIENSEDDNPNEDEAKTRRRSYKDSGYGSDGSKNNSMGSQNHEGEVFDVEEHTMKVLQQKMNFNPNCDVLPNLSIMSSETPTNSLPSSSSGESASTVSGGIKHQPECEIQSSHTSKEGANMPFLSVLGDEEREESFAGNIPFVSMLSFKDDMNYINKNGSMPSNVSASTGNDSSVCLPSDISGMPDPSYQTPSYHHVVSKYLSDIQNSSDNMESQAPRSSEEAEALPRSPFSMLIQMIQNDKSLLEKHLEDPLEFLKFLESLKLSPNMPSPYQQPNSATGTGRSQQHNESAIDLEYISRCRDSSCSDPKCNKVREAVIGLTQALAGRWSLECNKTIQQVGQALYHHTRSCGQHLYKCGIPMCHLLRSFTSGIEEVSQFLICQTLPCLSLGQRFYEFPAKGEFIQLTATGSNDVLPSPDVILITTFGSYGNVALFTEEEDTLVESKDLILKRILKNDHGRNNLAEVYRKLIGGGHHHIIPHMWLYNTTDYLYVCTDFMCGGTLAEYQDFHIFLQLDEATFIMQQLLSAVTFLHEKRIIYLYWTASNVLFKDTSRNQVYLSNLSMSLISNDKVDVAFHKSSLPACIVPPEIVTSDGYMNLQERSDVWGAGCLYAEMLTGKQMWQHLRHSSREAVFKEMMGGVDNMICATKDTVPPHLKSLLADHCWQHNVENRITVAALQDKLAQLLHPM